MVYATPWTPRFAHTQLVASSSSSLSSNLRTHTHAVTMGTTCCFAAGALVGTMLLLTLSGQVLASIEEE